MSQNQSKKRGLIFVISGPSGSGKTTLLARLLKAPELRGKLIKSISLTTRPRRSGEQCGRDYFFISKKRFLGLRKAKKILEWTRYLGYYYATPKAFIQKEMARGNNLALCLDLRGALRLRRLYPGSAVLIFIQPPSIKALWPRITQRCRRTKSEEVRQRIRLARQEMLLASTYDHCLINKNLEETVTELKNIILKELFS